jgi:hypothetical protein
MQATSERQQPNMSKAVMPIVSELAFLFDVELAGRMFLQNSADLWC